VPADGVHKLHTPIGDGKAIAAKCIVFFMVG